MPDGQSIQRLVTGLIQQLTRPLAQRVRLMASRGRITAVDDSGGVQRVQVSLLSGERISDVQLVQLFGTSGHAPVGSTCVVLCMGGSRTHPVAIAVDHPASRIRDLEAGEWVAYNAEGDFLRIKLGGEIHIKAASKVVMETPLVECTQDVHIFGRLDVDGVIESATAVLDPLGSMQEMRIIYNGHSHTEQGDGAPVSPPLTPMA
jgi:phage baseplate assembly protein V